MSNITLHFTITIPLILYIIIAVLIFIHVAFNAIKVIMQIKDTVKK